MSTLVSSDAFTMIYEHADDGIARLVMRGQLDLAVAGEVTETLTQRLTGGARLRLDLSRLEFLDSSGLRALIAGVNTGRASGKNLLVVDPTLQPQVRRVIDLVGVGPILFPTNSQVDARPDEPYAAPPGRGAV